MKWVLVSSLAFFATLVTLQSEERFSDYRASVILGETISFPDFDLAAISFEMAAVPGGEFKLGSREKYLDAPQRFLPNPLVRVRISPFWISKFEVSTLQYTSWLMTSADGKDGSIPRGIPPGCSDLETGFNSPAFGVTPMGAKMFCKWISEKTGHFFRLPTEAEWEYSCRAGGGHSYWFYEGENLEEAVISAKRNRIDFFENNSTGLPKTMTEMKAAIPNRFGIFSMQGGVSEWTQGSSIPDNYDGRSVLVDPYFPRGLFGDVVRGGDCNAGIEELRSWVRFTVEPTFLNVPAAWCGLYRNTIDDVKIGFRIVRPLNPPPKELWNSYWFVPAGQSDMEVFFNIPDSWKVPGKAVQEKPFIE